MKFLVHPVGFIVPSKPVSQLYLVEDNWNDWFTYKTMYTLYYVDEDSEKHLIGSVKIGQLDMDKEMMRPDIPSDFEKLSDDYFSLGQDVSYYSNLHSLGDDTRHNILDALNDIALKPTVYEKARYYDVTVNSLMRNVRHTSVTGQYRRLANGNAKLTNYKFTYTGPNIRGVERVNLSFEVNPRSNPPTNIHVLIGRNAVGKTHMINNMINSLIDQNSSEDKAGFFSTVSDEISKEDLFANVVSVSFSAFDQTEPLPERRGNSDGIPYSYVGLKKIKKKNQKELPPKSPENLKQEFASSLHAIKSSSKTTRWLRAIEMLTADPIFKEADVASILRPLENDNIIDESKDKQTTDVFDRESDDDILLKQRAQHFFHRLSSGHKIVLLTLTRLVETVEERTLVLLDEPEAHLHPPLLSAFTRALSDLLISRNAVAIIATHSPVILQEVPRSCVWKLRRSGTTLQYSRTEIETFGENIGALTREIFELEVTYSGFYKMLKDAVDKIGDYNRILEHFNNELGREARGIVRALLASKNREDE
ncbi:AAA family ATPase [Lederbergia graminis]|uniref:AAA family ATPase n=1 Tax=Lederbergia graminis TaxID=735518 RepID=A0ABW0LJ82_9BACI